MPMPRMKRVRSLFDELVPEIGARHCRGDVLQIVQIVLGRIIAADHADRDRHFLERLGTPPGGYDDLLACGRLRGGLRRLGRRILGDGRADREQRQRHGRGTRPAVPPCRHRMRPAPGDPERGQTLPARCQVATRLS
ncbi:MAG: hypothetical protein WDN69_19435 [Aliidongia sp.]